MKPFRHVGTPESYAEFVARHAWLRHLDHRAPDAKLIADVDGPFVQSLRGKVLAEYSVWQLRARKLCLPERIMFRRIDIHRLVPPAMNGEVSLLITIEIEPPKHEAADHRLFVDPGRHSSSMPPHRARTSDLH